MKPFKVPLSYCTLCTSIHKLCSGHARSAFPGGRGGQWLCTAASSRLCDPYNVACAGGSIKSCPLLYLVDHVAHVMLHVQGGGGGEH